MNTQLPWEVIVESKTTDVSSTGALYFNPNNDSLWFLDSGEWIVISNDVKNSITWVNDSMKVEENNAQYTINTDADDWADKLMEIMDQLDEEIEKLFDKDYGTVEFEDEQPESAETAYERAMRGI